MKKKFKKKKNRIMKRGFDIQTTPTAKARTYDWEKQELQQVKDWALSGMRASDILKKFPLIQGKTIPKLHHITYRVNKINQQAPSGKKIKMTDSNAIGNEYLIQLFLLKYFIEDNNLLGNPPSDPFSTIRKKLGYNDNNQNFDPEAQMKDSIEDENSHPFYWELMLLNYWVVIFISTNISIMDPKVTRDAFQFSYKTPFPSFIDLLKTMNKNIEVMKQK